MKGTPDPMELPFRRERLLALGPLALLAPIPLFFTNALELAVLAVYLGALGLVLLRARHGRAEPFSAAVLNAAGLAYLPLFLLDVRLGSHTLLKSMLHLLLFTTVMKLASVRRERDLSVALLLTGFLFVASVSTSFHYAILLYVIVFTALAWPVLVRWALWRDLAATPEEWVRDREAQALPGRGPLAAALTAAFLVAVPLFLVLPRLKAPYVKGFDPGREITTGFSEAVNPDLFGTIKKNDKVFLRITTERPVVRETVGLLRLRTLAFSAWDGRVWRSPERLRGTIAGAWGTLVPLADRRGVATGTPMTIDLLPLGSRYLPYPLWGRGLKLNEESFRLRTLAYVERDTLRNVRLSFEPERIVEYTAFTGNGNTPDTTPPDAEASRRPDSRRLEALARELTKGVDPSRDPAEAARRIENYLHRFTYTLELMPPGASPVEEFLFVRKAGHCQNFATAMALLLRELGVPTRFVTGFSGGEIGPFGRYVIVRGDNVHAWVEAWCGDQGWLTFDPTPAVGVPTLTTVPIAKRLKQIVDGIELFYDRYVLSFGQGDQAELLRKVREAFETSADAARAIPGWLRSVVAGLVSAGGRLGLLVVALPLVLLLVLSRMRRFRRSLISAGLAPASAAYRRLQRALRRHGAKLTPASAPAETLAAARSFGDAAVTPAREIVEAYVAESFGGISGDQAEAARLTALLRDLRGALATRKAA